MKSFTKPVLFAAIAIFSSSLAFAQDVEISGQFRPRYEMRNGYSTLIPEGELPANFISQRTRLNFKYSSEIFKIGFSLQNVGVWGETGTLTQSSVNGTMLHEAWGQVFMGEKVSLKVGRQEIIYDDHRILGSVDWAQQGRQHDAAIIMIQPKEECHIHLGFAYNALKETVFKDYYTINNYKAMQFAHWNRKFNKFGVSLLVLNNGVSYRSFNDTTSSGKVKEKIAYGQTMGTRLSYGNDKVKANAAFYYQMGNLAADTTNDGLNESTKKASAMYFAADVDFALGAMFTLGAGFEYLSGNSMKDPSDKDQAFKPLYGTNHKFNGFMDYFYVGNFMNSVGLIDIFIPFKFKKEKYSAAVIPHFFSSAAQVYGVDSNGSMKDYNSMLGTEVDLVFAYAIAKSVTLSAGYSHIIASESMEVVKSQPNPGSVQNWAWVMVDIKPTFFKTKKD
ncbi:MAG: hypothetical protein R2764_13775 [Bacteroidales bacterium]